MKINREYYEVILKTPDSEADLSPFFLNYPIEIVPIESTDKTLIRYYHPSGVNEYVIDAKVDNGFFIKFKSEEALTKSMIMDIFKELDKYKTVDRNKALNVFFLIFMERVELARKALKYFLENKGKKFLIPLDDVIKLLKISVKELELMSTFLDKEKIDRSLKLLNELTKLASTLDEKIKENQSE